jgi:hypothetical protein
LTALIIVGAIWCVLTGYLIAISGRMMKGMRPSQPFLYRHSFGQIIVRDKPEYKKLCVYHTKTRSDTKIKVLVVKTHDCQECNNFEIIALTKTVEKK